MQIIKLTDRRVVGMTDYRGVCHKCNSPIEYDGNLIVIILSESEDRDILVPIDYLICPFCQEYIETFTVYHNMEVSKELKL